MCTSKKKQQPGSRRRWVTPQEYNRRLLASQSPNHTISYQCNLLENFLNSKSWRKKHTHWPQGSSDRLSEYPKTEDYTGLPRNLRDKIPWLFHDRITKFHDLYIDIHGGWSLKSIRICLSNSMTFPWLFASISKFYDFSMTLRNNI